MSDEKRLIKKLLENYETIGIVGRPVFNTSDQIRVEYGIGLIQLLDLNEKDQILTTNVWCRYVSISIQLLMRYTTLPPRPSKIIRLPFWRSRVVNIFCCCMNRLHLPRGEFVSQHQLFFLFISVDSLDVSLVTVVQDERLA